MGIFQTAQTNFLWKHERIVLPYMSHSHNPKTAMNSMPNDTEEPTGTDSMVHDTEETTGTEIPLTLDDHKLLWIAYEGAKLVPRTQLKEITKKQRPSTKVLQTSMEENGTERMHLGDGWYMTHTNVETVTYNEDVCTSYLTPDVLERLKKENTKRKNTFKTIPPTKKARASDE